MDLTEIMLKRRSVRTFKPCDVPRDILDSILTAGLLAPTSRNRRPCELVLITDREVLAKLSRAKQAGSRFLAEASAAIAVFADSEKADTWIEDSSIALTYMMLAATEQGVGNCWCQYHLRSDASGEDAEQNARSILSMPEKYRIVGVLGLGIAAEEPPAAKPEDIDLGKVRVIG